MESEEEDENYFTEQNSRMLQQRCQQSNEAYNSQAQGQASDHNKPIDQVEMTV